jgi:hypothetical protein
MKFIKTCNERLNKMKKMIFITIYLSLIITSSIKAQEYLFYPTEFIDSTYGTVDTLDKINRYNLINGYIDNYPSTAQFSGNDAYVTIDHSQTYLLVSSNENNIYSYFLINTTDSSDYLSFPPYFGYVDEFLCSVQNNNLYFFSNGYSSIYVMNESTKEIIDSLNLSSIAFPSLLNFPKRNAFFSQDSSKIYFFSRDTLSGQYQVSLYLISSNELIQTRNLSEIGHPNSDGYSLTFGRNGKGIITSFPNYNNPSKDFYFRIYDFDEDTGSVSIYNNEFSDACFTDNGDFLLIMNMDITSSREVIYTGSGKIYNAKNGDLIKNVTVPQGGRIYSYDNYPNDIYYVLNLDSANTQPTVYNLTKLKINSISPPLALAYWATPIQPNVLTITINGEFFTDSTVAYFNGNAKPTTFVSDSVVTFTLNSIEFRSAADYPVWVTNYGAVSDTVFLSVVNTLPNPVVPSVQCMQDNGNHTFTVHFNYNNQNTVPVGVVAAPPNNTFSPGNYYRGQPSVFLPGNHTNAFSVIFDGSGLTWTLLGNSVTANKYTIRCP